MKKTIALVPVMMVAMFTFAGMASAHVTVDPDEVTQGSYQTFQVNVPAEKQDLKTTKVKVDIPKGVDVSRVEPKPDWDYQLDKDNSDKITSITWKTTGDGLSVTEFTQFKMSGKVGEQAHSLRFKAYQTYDDGSVVKWVEAEDSKHPASVTKVTAASSDDGDQGNSSWTANLPLYLSILAVLLGILAVIIATLKKKSH